MFSLQTLRRKAKELGYNIQKGNRHYMSRDGAVVRDNAGNLMPGYMVIDNTTGLAEWGSYDNNFTHLWDLEDVYNFLVSKGLKTL